MPTITERLAIIITGESLGGEGAFKKVGAASREAAQHMTVAQRALGQFGSIGPTGVITAGLAADALAISFGEKLVNKFADATSAVRAFQRVTGGTAEDSSRLVAAFNVLGVDAAKAGTAVFRLAKNLDGSQQKLEGMGVQIARDSSGGVDLTNTFLNIADAVHAVGAGFQADSIVATAFGAKVGKDLLPVLLRGRDGLKELFDEAARHHEIFSQADLESGRQFTLATNELHAALTGLEIEGGKWLVPMATSIARDGERVLGWVGTVMDKVESLREKGHRLGRDIDEWFGIHAKKDAVDLAAAIKEQVAATEAEDKAVKSVTTAAENAHRSKQALTDATKAITTAERAHTQAQADLNKLLAEGAVDAHKVAEAEDRVKQAAESTVQARRQEADAEAGLADARERLDKILHPSDRQKTDATLESTDALTGQQRAHERLGDAQKAVTDAILNYGRTSQEARDAVLDLKDAQTAVTRADERVTDAQQAVNDLTDEGIPKTADYKTALDGVKKAADDVATAQQGIVTATEAEQKAHDDLLAAQAGDPEWADKVAKARQVVADATDNVARAHSDAGSAAYAHQTAEDALNTSLSENHDATATVLDDIDKLIAKSKDPDYIAFLRSLRGEIPAPTGGGTGGARPGNELLRPGADLGAGKPAPVVPLYSPYTQITINGGSPEAIAKEIGKEMDRRDAEILRHYNAKTP